MHDTELTVGALLDSLRDLPDDTPVRFAAQPSWPFEHYVGEPLVMDTDHGDVVYLPEAGQVGYLSGDVAAELGWRG